MHFSPTAEFNPHVFQIWDWIFFSSTLNLLVVFLLSCHSFYTVNQGHPWANGTECSPHWSNLHSAVHVQVHTTQCRFYWEQLGPSAGVIYSWLHFQVHTTTHCRFYREQLGPSAGVIYSWLYMFKYTQHTAGFTENNWDPALELSTLDCTCSSTHNNTLQILLRTIGTQRWSYLLLTTCSCTHNNTLQVLLRTIGTQCWSYLPLTVHVQVHTTHCRFYWEQLGPIVGIIYSWLYMFKYTTTHCRFYWEQLGPSAGVIYSWLYMFKYT